MVVTPVLAVSFHEVEELEETAKLIFILGDRPIRYLTAGEIAELRS